MKRTTLIAGLTIFALAGTAVTASAMGDGKDGHGKGHRMGPMLEFSALDLNSDGKVTQEEMTAAMEANAAKRFADADANGDGALSAEEMLAKANSDKAERLQKRITKMIEKRDTNGDGLLSAEEMRPTGEKAGKRQGHFFAKLDKDGDGAVSEEEFAAMKERFGKKHKGGKQDES